MNTYLTYNSDHLKVWTAVDHLGDYEVLDYSVENQQYFGGCPMEDFDDLAIGIGNDYNESLEDALNQLSEKGRWLPSEIDEIYDAKVRTDDHNDLDTVDEFLRQEGMDRYDEGVDDDWQYFVAVRIKRESQAVDMNSHLRII